MSKPDGGQAFPQIISKSTFPLQGGGSYTVERGMSLRDWFAGQALVLASQARGILDPDDIEALVAQSYRLADAMLKEREK